MSENALQSQPAVMTAQITVTRAGTGKVEHYTITGTPLPAEPQPEQQTTTKEH